MAAPQMTSLPGYDLPCPSGDEAIETLVRLLGPQQGSALWEDACQSAGVGRFAPLALDQLQAVAESLGAHPGVAGVVGTSLLVRVRCYALLSERSLDRLEQGWRAPA